MRNLSKLKLFIFLLPLLTIVSCNDNGIEPVEEVVNYTPYAVSNYWTYDVESSLNGTSIDSLYISETVQTNSNTYFNFDASATSTGLTTQLYAQNLHRKENDNHLIYGTINIGDLVGNLVDLEIELNDEILLSETATTGTVLATQTNSITQVVNNIPLTIDYTFNNTLTNRLENLTINTTNYTDILQTELTLNLKIVALVDVLGIQVPFTVLQPQDVLVMENSYANEIGLIQSESTISYQLESIPGITFPFPSSNSETIVQNIRSFNINN